MRGQFTEELNFLKEQSEFLYKLKEKKEFLFEKINELKNDKDKLSTLINLYKEKVTRKTQNDKKGSVNIVRYTILQKLEKDETITSEVIEDLKKNII
ncbi:MAG: hypothetical protein LUH05_07885 [Candidatus Gastranaerophilales bacterium]|nr:hypothetical protein [Candidatus Gastranaerophilales bacterium]